MIVAVPAQIEQEDNHDFKNTVKSKKLLTLLACRFRRHCW